MSKENNKSKKFNKKLIITICISVFILLIVLLSLLLFNLFISKDTGKDKDKDNGKIEWNGNVENMPEYLKGTDNFLNNCHDTKDEACMTSNYGDYMIFERIKSVNHIFDSVIKEQNKYTNELLEKNKKSLVKNDSECSSKIKKKYTYRYVSRNSVYYSDTTNYQTMLFDRDYYDICKGTFETKTDGLYVYSKALDKFITQEEFLNDLGLTQAMINEYLNLDPNTVNEVFYQFDDELTARHYEKGILHEEGISKLRFEKGKY